MLDNNSHLYLEEVVHMSILKRTKYMLSEHPTIVNFRWSPTETWFSTWLFLFYSISFYILFSLFLHLFLALVLPRRHRIPLGLLPAFHSLLVFLVSAMIFPGILLSAAAEIRDTRWLWHHSHLKTPFQWLLCFPLGVRSSGRVFFWSYAFYLSRFLHLLRTFFRILRRRRLTFFHLFNQSFLICMPFLWLEFSQSFQVLAILLMTSENVVVYGYRFWIGIGFAHAQFPLVMNCQVVLLACNMACHVGVVVLHFWKGGCNGIGAWVFNSVCDVIILFLFLKFYLNKRNHGMVHSSSSHYLLCNMEATNGSMNNSKEKIK
ncbi:hypothetical protein Ancab_024101 [Ancistrocladus abbreviatus]